MKRKASIPLYGAAKRARYTGTGPLGRRLGGAGARALIGAGGKAALRGLGTIASKINPYLGAASLAYDAYRTYKSFTKKPRSKRSGAPAAYGGRAVKKFKRVSKRSANLLRDGISLHGERGGSITSKHVVFVGHATCPGRTVQFAASLALLKMVFKKLVMYDVKDIDETIPDLRPSTGSNFKTFLEFFFENQESGALTSDQLEVATTSTLAGLAQSLVEKMNYQVQSAFTTTNNNPGKIYLREIRFLIKDTSVGGTYVAVQGRIDVMACKVNLRMKSELKMQNESKIGTNTDSAAVDAVALTGVAYSGSGNNLVFKGMKSGSTGSNYKFIGDPQIGAIAPVHDEHPWTAFNEPPPAASFYGARKEANVLIQPGQIKKNSLYATKTVFYNQLFLSKLPWIGGAAPSWATLGSYAAPRSIGKVAVFALEKLIHQTTDDISVAYEIDYKIDAKITQRKTGYTNRANIIREIVDVNEDPV